MLKKVILVIVTIHFIIVVNAQQERIVKVYDVANSRQGIAVDKDYFYVINNKTITKHEKDSGKLTAKWCDSDSIIHHLNSGVIKFGKLYCCHSNYPDVPMASSIEIFNPKTMKHIGNHSFGILNGSATWVDWYKGDWYVVFAHYNNSAEEPNKNNSYTRLVQFDKEWRQKESWIFPKVIIEKFQGMSNSGGFIRSDGTIFCTGHDNHEIYLLEFPTKGYTLIWKDTKKMGGFGQGVAYEVKKDNEFIWGVEKKNKKVIVSTF